VSLSRREFLAASAAAGLSVAVPAVRGAEKEKKYKTALVGTGWWGMNILRVAVKAENASASPACARRPRSSDMLSLVVAAEVAALTDSGRASLRSVPRSPSGGGGGDFHSRAGRRSLAA